MERLGLEMHSEKTRLVNLARGKEGFTFLGWAVRKRRRTQRNPRWYHVQRWPSPKAMKRIRERVHDLTDVRGRQAQDMGEMIERLNPVLRGWGTYFRTGNADRQFTQADAPRMPCQKSSSVSCVPESGTHSLKGGAGNGSR